MALQLQALEPAIGETAADRWQGRLLAGSDAAGGPTGHPRDAGDLVRPCSLLLSLSLSLICIFWSLHPSIYRSPHASGCIAHSLDPLALQEHLCLPHAEQRDFSPRPERLAGLYSHISSLPILPYLTAPLGLNAAQTNQKTIDWVRHSVNLSYATYPLLAAIGTDPGEHMKVLSQDRRLLCACLRVAVMRSVVVAVAVVVVRC